MADINATTAQLTSELMKLTRAMQELTANSSRTQAAQVAAKNSYADMSDELNRHRDNLVRGRKLTSQEMKLVEKSIQAKREELKHRKEYERQKSREDSIKKKAMLTDSQRLKVTQAVSEAESRYTSARTKSTAIQNIVTQKLNSSNTALTRSIDRTNKAVGTFGAALLVQGKVLQRQYKATGGASEKSDYGVAGGMLKQQNQALLTRGISGGVMAELVKEQRQLVNALGGSDSALKAVDAQADRLQILLGPEAGLSMALKHAQQFAEQGIVPTVKSMTNLMDDIIELEKFTNMSTEQANSFFNELANETESLNILRNARADERDAILENQRQLVISNIALGMTATQAKAAASALNKIAGESPLERIKKAARVRAMAGALGLTGGEEAAQGIIAGPNRTTAQAAAVQSIGQQISNAVSTAASKGIGHELMVSQLAQGLQLGELAEKDSPFNTQLANVLKVDREDTAKRYTDITKDWLGELIGVVRQLSGTIQSFISGDHWVGALAAGMAAAWAGSKTLSMAKDLLTGAGRAAGGAAGAGGKGKGLFGSLKDKVGGVASKVGGWFGLGNSTAAATTANTAAQGAGVMSKVGSFFSKPTRVLGPLGGAAAGALEFKETLDNGGDLTSAAAKGVGTGGGAALGAWGGASTGAMIGTVAGPIGTAVGGAVGGIVGGIAGAWGGGKIADVGLNAAGVGADPLKVEEAEKASKEVRDATVSMSERMLGTTSKLDTSNEYLKKISVSTDKSLELSAKLVTLLERMDPTNPNVVQPATVTPAGPRASYNPIS